MAKMRHEEYPCFYAVVLIGLGLLCQMYGATKNDINNEHVAIEDLVQHRMMRNAGYEYFEIAKSSLLYHEDENTEKERVSINHVRQRRDVGGDRNNKTITLHIHAALKKFEFEMKYTKSVLNDKVRIDIKEKNLKRKWNGKLPDCFLIGNMKNQPGASVSISYCDKLEGAFADGNQEYWFQSVEGQGSDVFDHDVLVAAKKFPTFKDKPSSQAINRIHRGRKRTKTKHKKGNRVKREDIPLYIIETAIVMDSEYVDVINNTDDFLVQWITLVWNGVQAEWSKVDQLGAEVIIDVKRIEIWKENANDYDASSSSLDNTLQSFCNSAQNTVEFRNFDHTHMFTGHSGTDVNGMANNPVCQLKGKCALSATVGLSPFIPAHELGHVMYMIHDNEEDVPCLYPLDGIMGSKTFNWSECSRTALVYLAEDENIACLSTQNVINDEQPDALVPRWIGMTHTPDEICELRLGPGYRFRSYPIPYWGICAYFSCVDMDVSSATYGIFTLYKRPIDGMYCGEEMVCHSDSSSGNYRCHTWGETGLDQSYFVKQDGGWSAWGAKTPCSRSCGTGVKLRKRTCTDPIPLNTHSCDGYEYDVEFCNTNDCEDDATDKTALIQQRASETCAHIKSADLYTKFDTSQSSSNYLSTGQRYSSKLHGQCEVKCDRVEGYSAPSNQRYGIIPDGTPCNPELFVGFVETNYLPRRLGLDLGTCIQGYCLQMGCDDEVGFMTYDECGVCGGDNTTCVKVEGTFAENVTQDTRATIVEIPANAFLIQIYFVWGDMKRFYLELVSKDDVYIVAYKVGGVSSVTNNIDNPASWAGTHWYFKSSVQYLHAMGPTDQKVVIKVYNDDGKPNTGINYAYSLPLDQSTCTPRTCENAGVWNTSTCTCDCQSGFYGLVCNSCERYCPNNQPHTADCKCNCGGNTYGKNNCVCRYPFKGPDCNTCKITKCQNGGTFDSTACRCTCPPGYGELDCSTPCQNAKADNSTCDGDAAAGKCDSNNAVMEENCYLACGLCTLSQPTTSTTSTDAPTSAPTSAPKSATTSAPTSATTSAPTSATTSAPTSATTSASTSAPTSATTSATTSAPTDATTDTPTTLRITTPTTSSSGTTPKIFFVRFVILKWLIYTIYYHCI